MSFVTVLFTDFFCVVPILKINQPWLLNTPTISMQGSNTPMGIQSEAAVESNDCISTER